MKKLLLLFLIFASCQKPTCPTCYVIHESDQRKQCGYQSNGWELISTTSIGEFCDQTQITAARNLNTKEYRLYDYECEAYYTLRSKLECK